MTSLQLTPTANALVAALHDEFLERWQVLPQAQGASVALAQYRAAPVPLDLQGRRVELIVEASDTDMLRRALASGADAVAVDFDDTFSPTLANVQAAYDALAWVAQSDKPLLARTRALYAIEPHLDFNGPGIAALCDLSAILTTRPFHLYIPKLETVPEAQFWHDVLAFAEAHLGLTRNTVKVCLQIETFHGLLNADALLYALHERAYGLNAGRWDYVFSLTKHLGKARTQPIPPRSQLTMDVDAMHAYAEHLVSVAQQRGAEAIGGTAAISPDPQNPKPALETVLADKQREAAQGFTAAWAGLPELLDAVRAGFSRKQAAERVAQVEVHRLTILPTASQLPVAEVKDSISLALEVFQAWFGGRGVITRGGRIEDTATAELARALVWQWVRVKARLDDGTVLDQPRYLSERRTLVPDTEKAAQLLDHLVLADLCPAYFPREAQRLFGGLA